MHWDTNYIPELERTIAQRVEAAGYFLVSRIREAVSVNGRTIGFRTITRGPNKGQTQRVIGPIGSNPSAPGMPPHKQRGRYRASIAQDHRDGALTTRVGTNMQLGRWLELGTLRMAARPHLRPTLAANRAAIRSMIITGKP